MRILALAGTCLLLAVTAAVALPQALAGVAPSSCGSFQPFGTVTESAVPFHGTYQLYSRGGAYNAVFAWGDGTTSAVTVNASNTPENPVVLDNTYEEFGSYVVNISTVGTLSDGTPCSDTNVTLGTLVIAPPGPVSCGTFSTFDPPGRVNLEAGDAISYTLESQDATLTSARVEWGDGASTPMPRALGPGGTFDFPAHAYDRAGSYDVYLNVSGTLGTGLACHDRVKVGTVVVTAPPPLPPVVAKHKCDAFLRKAKGRVGTIIHSAARPPVTKCGTARGSSRTCTTTVIVTKCKCRYVIKTRVPAKGKPKVIKIARKRLSGGGHLG
jgi:hypothetical protein